MKSLKKSHTGLPPEWSPSLLHCHFDVPLDQCPTRKFAGHRLPVLPVLLWRHLVNSGGLDSEGIFRTEPSGKLRDEVKCSIVENKFNGCDDPNVCASIIKSWLRGLRPRLLDHVGSDAASFRVATKSCERTILEIEKKCSKLAFDTMMWILDRMIDITSREKKNRMNPNALATIFSMCLVSEDKEISENSAATLALQMAMVRTREHQFAVRDFLVKCMEWRSNSKKPRTFSSSSSKMDDDSDDTDTDSGVEFESKSTWCSSVVFEREAREFQSFHTHFMQVRQDVSPYQARILTTIDFKVRFPRHLVQFD